jgi:hypothetical protein
MMSVLKLSKRVPAIGAKPMSQRRDDTWAAYRS